MVDKLILVPYRLDAFRVDLFNKTYISLYDIDFIDEIEVAEFLGVCGRDYVKRGLALLSSGYRKLFKSAPKFKNDKAENKYYLEKLKELVEDFNKNDFEEVIELKADEVYIECQNLENEIRRPYSEEYKERKQKELNKCANIDVDKWLSIEKHNLISTVNSIIAEFEGFYSGSKDSRLIKAEQRKREFIFCRIMQGFGFFLDTEGVAFKGFENTVLFSNLRTKYSICDILAVYRSIPGLYKFYDFTLSGLYNCLDSYHREIEHFADFKGFTVDNSSVEQKEEEIDAEEAEQKFQNIMARIEESRKNKAKEEEQIKNKSSDSVGRGYWVNRLFEVEEFKQ